MTTEILAEPAVIQVDADGRLSLDEPLLTSVGLREGDRVIVLPLNPGFLYLRKENAPEPPSREELSRLMQSAFEEAGYASREQVLKLVREAKSELTEA